MWLDVPSLSTRTRCGVRPLTAVRVTETIEWYRRIFLRGEAGWDVKLTSHLHLVPRLNHPTICLHCLVLKDRDFTVHCWYFFVTSSSCHCCLVRKMPYITRSDHNFLICSHYYVLIDILVKFTVIVLCFNNIFYESVVLLLVTQDNGFDLDGVGWVVFLLWWPCCENI